MDLSYCPFLWLNARLKPSNRNWRFRNHSLLLYKAERTRALIVSCWALIPFYDSSSLRVIFSTMSSCFRIFDLRRNIVWLVFVGICPSQANSSQLLLLLSLRHSLMCVQSRLVPLMSSLSLQPPSTIQSRSIRHVESHRLPQVNRPCHPPRRFIRTARVMSSNSRQPYYYRFRIDFTRRQMHIHGRT